MADGATQDERIGKLATPLGKDKLLLSRFEGVEGMGEFFEFRVEALSTDSGINFDQALGRNSSVHLKTSDGGSGRDFSGVLTQARSLGKRGDYYGYSLVLRPWLWLLSLTSDCRIFPNMKPNEIIKQVFEDRGFNDVLDLMAGDYPKLEYTVQYRETDLNFVLRLMEEYGIYYYFKFMPGDGSSPSMHYLVLADSTTHEPLPSPSDVIFLPPTAGEQRGKQQFNDWSKMNAMVSGVFTLNDYDYEKPGKDLLEKAQQSYQFEHGDMEVYNYPGGYDDPNVGMNMAKVSRDAERTRNLRWSASGYAPGMTPGFTINRTSTNGDPDDGNYLILRCTHAYGVQTYQTAAGAPAGEIYSGAYELSKSDIPYRMPLHTRKPVIAGSQSALVVGKQGEEIDVDKEGRILVEFYWDRKTHYKDVKKKQSRRVRVAQIWAGAHRGALFTPRIGDEVMIQYEEGDPDRPLVVGSVYNGDNKVPADLPAKKTYSGILTKSSKNSNGYNMLLFDDTAGSERVKLRCQRDLMFKALRNEQRDINGSQTENIGGDETITVGGPTGGGNFTVNATKKIMLTVGINTIIIDMESISLTAPTITLTASAAVTITAPEVTIGAVLNTPELNAGAGTVGGVLPLV